MCPAERWSRIRSDFISQGVRCGGELFLPAGVERPPAVILAHGFAAERTFRLPAYAERFVERGMAAYLFDYRCFGDSDGEPRYLVDPRRHVQDWQAAVAHVRTLPEVDGGRLALWGSSFSGGHVLVTAAHDPQVAAVVAQVPFVDSLTTLLKLGPWLVLRAVPHALWDVLRAAAGRSPHYVKVVGRPDEFAAINTPETWPGYLALVPEGSTWENRCAARGLLTLVLYRPIASAGRVRCPVLIQYGQRDSLIHPASVERTAARLADCTLVKYPFGHFDIYTGPAFEAAVEMQSEFLAAHLQA